LLNDHQVAYNADSPTGAGLGIGTACVVDADDIASALGKYKGPL
jgi:hypothetical protein